MNPLSDQPDPGLIYDLYSGVFRPQIVRIALMLDVFSSLVAGPKDAEAVARACRCNPTGMAFLLDCLTCMKVLTKQDNLYALSQSAATFLVPAHEAYTGDLILAFSGAAVWEGVQRALRTGRPVPFEEYHEQDAWLESYSARRISTSLEMWQAAGISPQPDEDLFILDVACGCAIKTLSLAQKYLSVHVTCVDTPRVLPVTHSLAERMHVLPRTSFVAADLLTADLGVDTYDVCLLGQITDYLPERQNRDLFRRIHTALRPGGTLVIDVPMSGEHLVEWTSIVSLLLWANGSGGTHSFDMYHAWLEDVGFVKINQLGDRWLSAEKQAALL